MKKELLYRVFSHLPELLTDRLTLRKLTVADDADMYEYASRSDVTKYLTWYPHPDKAYTREYLHYLAGRYAGGMFYDWAIVYEPDSKMVGTCGFTSFNCAADSAEVSVSKAYERLSARQFYDALTAGRSALENPSSEQTADS